MTAQAILPTPRIFYGWFVVAAAFAVTFIGFGSAYTFSAFLDPLQRDFGASRGSVSLVFSLAGFLYFGLGIVSGPLADRFGSRRLAVAGMILMAIGLVAASVARSLLRGLCRLRARRWPRRRLRLRPGHRRRAALVRAAPRLRFRSRRQRNWCRHAGHATAGLASDPEFWMAWRLSRAWRDCRRRGRRARFVDRERSARPRPRS